MKLALLLAFLMVGPVASAEGSNWRICDAGLKSKQTLFQTALNNLSSFTYVRQAIETARHEAEPSQTCVSMVPLATNAYGYYQYYIQVEVGAPEQTPRHRFNFVFQDASVQAFHNVGGQPWVGIDSKFIQQLADHWVQQSQFVPFTNGDNLEQEPLTWVRQTKTYQSQQARLNPETVSAIQLPTSDPSERIYLVSWMDAVQSGNPISTPLITHGVLIRFKADRTVEVAEKISPSSDWLFPLEERLAALKQALPKDHQEWTQTLLENSKP